MLARAGTRRMRSSHSLTVEATSRSNITATVLTVSNFTSCFIARLLQALTPFFQWAMHKSCSKQDTTSPRLPDLAIEAVRIDFAPQRNCSGYNISHTDFDN